MSIKYTVQNWQFIGIDIIYANKLPMLNICMYVSNHQGFYRINLSVFGWGGRAEKVIRACPPENVNICIP